MSPRSTSRLVSLMVVMAVATATLYPPWLARELPDTDDVLYSWPELYRRDCAGPGRRQAYSARTSLQLHCSGQMGGRQLT